MSMMTTLCTKAVRQRGNDINIFRTGPHLRLYPVMLLYYGLVQYCYGRCCRLVGPTHEINRLLLIAETKSSENCTTKKNAERI